MPSFNNTLTITKHDTLECLSSIGSGGKRKGLGNIMKKRFALTKNHIKTMVEPLKKDSNNDMEKKNEVKNEIDNVRLALSKQSLGDEMDVQSQSSPKVVRERTRSLNAPSPIQQFGPCGRIMKNSAMVMTIQDPASQRLTWYKPPLTVLVIKKVRDAMVIPPFIQLVKWFINEKRMVVFVESAVMDDTVLTRNPEFGHIQEKLMTFDEKKDDLTDKIDFVVCLGGDGTLLYASSLFQQSVPPIMAFHLGSLGFLTPFKFDDFEAQVTHVLEGHAALTLRSRLRCILMKKEEEETSAKPNTNQLVLNEVVIDRGPSPYLSNIDLYLDGKLITSVQGDGLIVSTPTGSTAYAVAAGASMIHPSVPAVMVTPICPHSLSFRPIVVPAGVELKISVSPDSRNTAWVSFDGRMRQELCHGDSLRVTTSIYPIPSISAQDQITDWFDSLAECLHWNVRKKQKTLDELSDLSSDPYDEIKNET